MREIFAAAGVTAGAEDIRGFALAFTVGAAILAAAFRVTLATRMSALLRFVHDSTLGS